jgi:hypothetical protein
VPPGQQDYQDWWAGPVPLALLAHQVVQASLVLQVSRVLRDLVEHRDLQDLVVVRDRRVRLGSRGSLVQWDWLAVLARLEQLE